MNRDSVRLLIGALLALPVTGGLFFIMQYLIAAAHPEIDNSKRFKLADILMPEREIETNLKEQKPDKVENPEEPPPDLATPDVALDNVDVEVVNIAPKAQVEVAIESTEMATGDGEYLPIVKVAPIYPNRAQSRGITGYCIVGYTVTTSGAIRDPKVVDCQPAGVFEEASLKASLKFKYKPRVVDGVAIEVAGVQNKFTYELEN
jgi:protein TonB